MKKPINGVDQEKQISEKSINGIDLKEQQYDNTCGNEYYILKCKCDTS